MGQLKVAIVHDDLVQWGGAERVLLGLCEIFPDAPIFTSVFDFDNSVLKKNFSNRKIFTSFLQKIPGWKSLYKALMPLYPLAFEQFNFDNFDLVISHTTRFAKAIITKPETKHICFCHTPPRFLWHFSGEKTYGIGEILMSKLRLFDQVSANRVDSFLAGSKNAQKRIKKIYKRDSKVCYPFVDLDRFRKVDAFDGGYFVVIGRLNKYKRVDLALDACTELSVPIKVVGIGSQLKSLQTTVDRHQNVEFLENITDEILVQILAGAKALIMPGEEDFGITSLEAQALGKPVIAFKGGGALETIIDNKTGILFNNQSRDSLIGAIKRLDSIKINSADCKQNANRFSKENFTGNFKATIASL